MSGLTDRDQFQPNFLTNRAADMFLTPQELQRLTGYARSSAQIRWLRKNGWRFTVNGLKEPIVAVAESERKLVSEQGNDQAPRTEFRGVEWVDGASRTRICRSACTCGAARTISATRKQTNGSLSVRTSPPRSQHMGSL